MITADKMYATFTAQKSSDDSLSTSTPASTKSASADTEDAVLSTSVLIYTELQRDLESSIISRTSDDKPRRSLEMTKIPVYMQTLKINSSTSAAYNSSLPTDHSPPDGMVEVGLREWTTSSAQNIVMPDGVVNRFVWETTAKTESEDSSFQSNQRKFTTAVPLRDSNQSLKVSQMHISEVAQKTLLLHDAAATARLSDHVLTLYSPTTNVQFTDVTPSSALSTLHKSKATLQKSSTLIAKMQQEVAHDQFASSRLQFTADQETTSQSSVASAIGYMDVYTSASYHNGEQ